VRCKALLILCFILVVGCSRKAEPPGIRRIAIPPAENLTGRADLDWVAYAVSQVAASALMGAPGVHPVPVRSARDAAAGGAVSLLLIRYGLRDGALEFRADVRSVQAQRTELSFFIKSPPENPALAAGEQIAKRISGRARAFGTASEQALHEYAMALQGGSADEVIAGLRRALELDAAFGESWVALVQTLAETGRRQEALKALAEARQAGNKVQELERARLDWLGASLEGDLPGQVRALAVVTRLLPGDVVALSAAARAEQAMEHYPEAAAWFRKAAAADPQPATWWNQALYASAFAGDWTGVEAAFHAYRKAAPEDPNAFDSFGEAAFHLGRFADADKAFGEAYRLNSGFLSGRTLYKAALAQWAGGNRQKAAERFREFMEARRNEGDPLCAYWEARWLHLNGDSAAALEKLQTWVASAAEGDPKAIGLAQMAVWQMATDRQKPAEETSRRALAAARTPLARTAASAAAIVCAGRAPEQAPDAWIAYRLLLAGKTAEAIPLLERIRKRGTPSETGAATALLAWAYLETGKQEEARRLAGRFPIPSAGADDLFEFLIYPRFLAVRKALGM